MPTPNRPLPQNQFSEQNILNTSYDTDFGVLSVEPIEYNGQGLQRQIATSMSLKMETSGSVKYIAIAKPGTAQSEAKWQCKKLDTTSGLVITWADGNADFDNTADSLSSLTYT